MSIHNPSDAGNTHASDLLTGRVDVYSCYLFYTVSNEGQVRWTAVWENGVSGEFVAVPTVCITRVNSHGNIDFFAPEVSAFLSAVDRCDSPYDLVKQEGYSTVVYHEGTLSEDETVEGRLGDLGVL